MQEPGASPKGNVNRGNSAEGVRYSSGEKILLAIPNSYDGYSPSRTSALLSGRQVALTEVSTTGQLEIVQNERSVP